MADKKPIQTLCSEHVFSYYVILKCSTILKRSSSILKILKSTIILLDNWPTRNSSLFKFQQIVKSLWSNSQDLQIPCFFLQTGIEKLTNLKVLFASNNKIKEWAEVERLKCLPALENLLLAGNPLHQEYKEKNAVNEYRIEVSFCIEVSLDKHSLKSLIV